MRNSQITFPVMEILPTHHSRLCESVNVNMRRACTPTCPQELISVTLQLVWPWVVILANSRAGHLRGIVSNHPVVFTLLMKTHAPSNHPQFAQWLTGSRQALFRRFLRSLPQQKASTTVTSLHAKSEFVDHLTTDLEIHSSLKTSFVELRTF